ncbi:hypothetical protein SAMN05216571_102398 [Onishia taeanensis]|uniref:Uncharacterized protein n=1 Tax=Onishia taeanensis TaxID=284577 RepID=A0A1G7PM52_9GAMM|nr:hypothetical protein SAMN05216571_102398 [Halomonas taeanensis]
MRNASTALLSDRTIVKIARMPKQSVQAVNLWYSGLSQAVFWGGLGRTGSDGVAVRARADAEVATEGGREVAGMAVAHRVGRLLYIQALLE